MSFEGHEQMVDWVVGIRRDKNGEVLSVYDSRKKPTAKRVKNLLRYLLIGKKAHNTMTNAGFAVTSALIAGLTATAFTAVGIGTGTTNSAAGDTALQTETKRKAVTPTQTTTTVTNDTTVWDATFSNAVDGLTGTTAITEVGVLNSATTGGTLLVHFASSTVMATCVWANGDTFEAIVKIKSEQGS